MSGDLEELPVAVIGGGPVGLAAAAHLIRRGIPVRVYEAGACVGTNILDWAHVRTFSPWRYSVDTAAVALLRSAGWHAPEADALPTGADLYERYLKPLAAVPAMAAAIRTNSSVRRISRSGVDKVTSGGRAERPFALAVANGDGSLRRELARAVIDASGTWVNQNPLGADGMAADGEAEFSGDIDYGIPDVLGRDRAKYLGCSVLVVGAGYSAGNVLIDLVKLAEEQPKTSISWAVRRADPTRLAAKRRISFRPAVRSDCW
jgi:cation diffusion facilitator CzcD-associated flavoprotein CzcO